MVRDSWGDKTSVLWSQTLKPDSLVGNIKDVAMCQRIMIEEVDLKQL